MESELNRQLLLKEILVLCIRRLVVYSSVHNKRMLFGCFAAWDLRYGAWYCADRYASTIPSAFTAAPNAGVKSRVDFGTDMAGCFAESKKFGGDFKFRSMKAPRKRSVFNRVIARKANDVRFALCRY